METIIVGYDGSDAGERALVRAAEVAEAMSARLVVVSVTRSPRVVVPVPVLERAGPVLAPGTATGPVAVPLPEVEPPPEPAQIAERQLERARMSLASRTVIAEYVAEVGDPAERLLDVAEQRNADLIVVGSPDRGLLDRLLGRPVDKAVVRRADRDVLLVH